MQTQEEQNMIKEAIIKLAKKEDLTYAEAEQVMNEIMEGKATDVQKSAYLTALSMKGETIDEITASASGMRAHCIKLLHDMDVLEIVGTGGDGSNSFNISTTSSMVIAAAGIPVTHRGKSRSFHVVTAHTKGTADSLPEGLKELVAVEGTLVFLMGMHQLSKLAGRLMEYGKSPETPAAVVQGNFDGKTVSVRGTLFDIAEKVKESGMQSPAVIVIGETAEMEL